MVVCIFHLVSIPPAAAGIARGWQLNSLLPWQTVWPYHRPPPARQGRMPCWVNSVRLSASVVAHKGYQRGLQDVAVLSLVNIAKLFGNLSVITVIQKVMLLKNGEARQCSIIS